MIIRSVFSSFKWYLRVFVMGCGFKEKDGMKLSTYESIIHFMHENLVVSERIATFVH